MESIEAKEAEQLGHDLAELSLDSAYPPPDNEEAANDQEYNYDWLLGTRLFNNVVVVDNLPVVGADILAKLESWVQRNCSIFGEIKKNGVSIPLHPQTRESLGYCFIEYNTLKEAENAQKNINGRKMDKEHTLSAYLYNEFDRIMDTSAGRTPLETATYTAGENLHQCDEKVEDEELRHGKAKQDGEEEKDEKSVEIKEVQTIE